jgi:hypothetical protein
MGRAGGSLLRKKDRLVPSAVSGRTRSQVGQGVNQPDATSSPSNLGWPVPAAGGGPQARRQGGSPIYTTHQEAGKLTQDRRQIPVAVRANQLSQTVSALPRIQVRIGQRTFNAILDSGATSNFVSGRLFQPGRLSKQTLDLASQRATIEASGSLNCSLHVGDQTYEDVTFLVVDELRDDVILGLQWLRDSRATMDFTLGCVHHGVTSRHTTYWNRERPFSANTGVPETVIPSHGFPPSCAREFRDIVREFASVLNEQGATATVRVVTHVIRLIKDEPFRIRPYHLSEDKKRALYECVGEMLATGVIERSDSIIVRRWCW